MKTYRIWTFCLSVAAALVLCCSCEDEKLNSVYQIFDDNPASNTLAADENFSEWVKVLRYSDLYNALNQATQAFTVLAPDNDAVRAFYASRSVDSIQQLGKDYARALILHHTVLDSIKVENMQLQSELSNLNDDMFSVEIDPDNAGQFIFGGVAHTIESGVHAYNALMYYIDAVMTPLVETVYDRLCENDRYSLMKAAVEATGWDKNLTTSYDTLPLPTGGYEINRRAYTLLAVSDEAFRKHNISSLEGLASKLGAGSDYTSAENALNEFVAYHILKSAYTLDDLHNTGSDTSRIWETCAYNQVVMITADTLQGIWTLNLLDSENGSTRFVESGCDIRCKNGYFHEIDAMMPVWEPVPSTVVWDLADYPEVRNKVGAADYQPKEPVSSEKKVDISNCGAYEYTPSESGVGGTTYAYVTYVTCKKNLKECNHYDRVAFNLGYMGSVSMRTPTIVSGKYKVEVQFVYLSDHNYMRQMSDGNGGMIKMSIDGDQYVKSTTPYTTVGKNSAGVYSATLYDEVEFEQTGNHEFKFVVMDPSASTNSKFSLQFDCIIFTPIE